MTIDLKPFLESIKIQLTTGAFAQIANAEVAGLEYLKDVEKRFLDIAAGVAKEELSYNFVVKALAEEPDNIKAFIISYTSGLVADAETLAKGIVSEFEKFLREQLLTQ